MKRNIFVRYGNNVYGYGYDETYMKILGSFALVDDLDELKRCFSAVFSETDTALKLAFNNIKFDTSSKTFSEEEKFSFEFDKNTKEGKVVNLPTDIYDEERYRLSIKLNIIPETVNDIALYISSVIQYNENVREYLTEKTYHISQDFKNIRYGFYTPMMTTINTLRFVTENLIEMEKLITSDNSEFLMDLLKTRDSKLQKGKKLHQVIDLPAFALNYIKENDLMAAKPVIQNIASEFDGNTLKILLGMFESFLPYEKYDSKRKSYYNNPTTKKITFLNNIYSLLQKKYKISDLLNYLLKQRMYWSDANFGFPYDEAKTLVDYIAICEKYDLNYEKYPQNLTKYHDIVVKNIEVLESDDEKKEAFSKAVSDYYSKDIEVGDYVFTAPTTVASLVAEGDELHHCIGNYSDSIINGISRIYFMREKKDPKKSFVTLELNKDNDLVEFKGDYNKEPSDADVKSAINSFVKKVKKGGI